MILLYNNTDDYAINGKTLAFEWIRSGKDIKGTAGHDNDKQ